MRKLLIAAVVLPALMPGAHAAPRWHEVPGKQAAAEYCANQWPKNHKKQVACEKRQREAAIEAMTLLSNKTYETTDPKAQKEIGDIGVECAEKWWDAEKALACTKNRIKAWEELHRKEER